MRNKNSNNSSNKKEKDDENSKFKSKKNIKCSVECLGKFLDLDINEDEKKDLNTLKYKLMKSFNIKKIPIEKMVLFFRESKQLSYERISQNNLNKLDKYICIKISFLPNEKLEKKDDNINLNLLTNLEIQDVILDNAKLKELYKKEKFQNLWNEPNQSLIAKLLTKIYETKGIKLLAGKFDKYNEISKRCLQNISV